jgi:hypothetical protein
MFLVLALFVVFAIILFSALSSGRTSHCRWRRDRTEKVEGLAYWRCDACGAQEKTTGGRPPNVCHARTRR